LPLTDCEPGDIEPALIIEPPLSPMGLTADELSAAAEPPGRPSLGPEDDIGAEPGGEPPPPPPPLLTSRNALVAAPPGSPLCKALLASLIAPLAPADTRPAKSNADFTDCVQRNISADI